jgi:hypothetical protein
MRSRYIKPGFFLNYELAQLPPLARLLFQGLWCLADKDGRLWDRPQQIKAECLPYDKANPDALLQKLHESGFIRRYETQGKRCMEIVNFSKHQALTSWEAKTVSDIPAPQRPEIAALQTDFSSPNEALPPELELNRIELEQKDPPPPDGGAQGAETEETAAQKYVGQLLAFRREDLGVKRLPVEQGEAAAAKWMQSQHYTLEQVEECYRFLKQQKWRGAAVTLITVKGQIAAWLKGELDVGGGLSPPPTGQAAVDEIKRKRAQG